MDSGTVATSSIRDSAVPQRFPESVLNYIRVMTVATGVWEKIVLSIAVCMELSIVFSVLETHTLGNGDTAVFPMLCISDCEDAVFNIYVLYLKRSSLAGPQAAADKCEEQHRYDDMPIWILSARLHVVEIGNEVSDFLIGKNIWHKALVVTGRDFVVRAVCFVLMEQKV